VGEGGVSKKAAKKPEHFMPFFFGDFLAATFEWEGEERALYALLLLHQWSAGSLPGEPRRLCKAIGYSWEHFEPWWPTVREKFVLQQDGRLINRRLEVHRAKTHELSAKNSASGAKGAAKRWGKDGDAPSDGDGDSVAGAMHSDGERHADASMANAKQGDSERHADRHKSANGVTDGNPSIPSHPNPSIHPNPESTQSAREGGASGEGAPETDPDRDPRNREAFERLRAGYPIGAYPQSDWLIGEREACRRVEEGARWSELEAGELRYRDQLVARGKAGTEFVYSPKNFFTAREKRWTEPWPLPRANGKPEIERWRPPPDPETGVA
jgi:uncharacterized protein YdaU (DUF1376 family)